MPLNVTAAVFRIVKWFCVKTASSSGLDCQTIICVVLSVSLYFITMPDDDSL